MRAQTSGLTIHYAPIIAALAERVVAGLTEPQPISLATTAILLVGRGSYNPDNNAEIARIARLLWEGRPYGWVEAAYYQQTAPGIGAGLRRCCQLGRSELWLPLAGSTWGQVNGTLRPRWRPFRRNSQRCRSP